MEKIICAFCRRELGADHVGPCPDCGSTSRRVVAGPPPSKPDAPDPGKDGKGRKH